MHLVSFHCCTSELNLFNAIQKRANPPDMYSEEKPGSVSSEHMVIFLFGSAGLSYKNLSHIISSAAEKKNKDLFTEQLWRRQGKGENKETVLKLLLGNNKVFSTKDRGLQSC